MKWQETQACPWLGAEEKLRSLFVGPSLPVVMFPMTTLACSLSSLCPAVPTFPFLSGLFWVSCKRHSPSHWQAQSLASPTKEKRLQIMVCLDSTPKIKEQRKRNVEYDQQFIVVLLFLFCSHCWTDKMKSPRGADLRTAAILEFYREKNKNGKCNSRFRGRL